MAKHERQSKAEVVSRAKRFHEVMPKLTKLPKELDGKVFGGEVVKYEAAVTQVREIEAERARAVMEQNRRRKSVDGFMKRVRDSVKGIYGDDSFEYELVGGVRASMRKRPVRRPKVAKAA